MKNRSCRNALLVASCLLAAVGGARPATLPDPDALDAVLDGYVDDGYYPFLYARLEGRDGDVLYEHATVNRELLPDAEINAQTWIRIWSMSKIVTISVVMDLVEDGVLKLSDPVAKYLPEFADLQVAVAPDGSDLSALDREERADACPFRLAPTAAKMTLLQLVNHEAGFYYATTNVPCIDEPLAARNVAAANGADEFIARLAELPLVQQPGARYHYGLNTTVLGMAAERAAKKSLKQLVEERLTGPLGIAGLRYGLPPGAELLPRISGQDGALREARPGELDIFGRDVPSYDPARALYLGGEGMLATAEGYLDFLRMLLNRGTLNGQRFLEQGTVATLHAPHTLIDNPNGYNGYNLWVTREAMGEAGLWTGGGYEGTHFWVDPKREFVGVLFSQMFWIPQGGGGRNEAFRSAVYGQLRAAEAGAD